MINLKKKSFFSCLLLFLLFLFFFGWWWTKEPFQEKEDPLYIMERFCNQQYGKDLWTMDNAFVFNEKLVFFVVRAGSSTISLSLQPFNRAIIVEHVKGENPHKKKRVYRY